MFFISLLDHLLSLFTSGHFEFKLRVVRQELRVCVNVPTLRTRFYVYVKGFYVYVYERYIGEP